jgi:hypothetical protein
MQYFTQEWWESDDPAATVAVQYANHFETIRSELPRDLVELHDHHTIHDARVTKLDLNRDQARLVLVLNGWDTSFKHRIQYTLCFLGVFNFFGHPPRDENFEEELGELGYWECYVMPNGIRVCILFASGAQFTIDFGNLELRTHGSGAA